VVRLNGRLICSMAFLLGASAATAAPPLCPECDTVLSLTDKQAACAEPRLASALMGSSSLIILSVADCGRGGDRPRLEGLPRLTAPRHGPVVARVAFILQRQDALCLEGLLKRRAKGRAFSFDRESCR